MTFRQTIQTAVIKSNRIWPFSYTNRAAYGLAIRAFVGLCKTFPEIKSVYLRHSLLRTDWIPGTSDIDLTVIFDPAKTVELEFSFLSAFWKKFCRLRKYFPMLGEADLVSKEFFSSWTRFGIRGYESAGWKLIYGGDIRKWEDEVDPDRLSLDSLNHALLYFFDFFLPRLYSSDRSELAMIQIRRVYSKILRYMFYDAPASGKRTPGSKSDMLCALLSAFDERLQLFSRTTGEIPFPENTFLPPCDPQNPAQELAPFEALIETCYLSSYNNILVLRNPNSCDSIIDSIRDWLNRLNDRPKIVTTGLFHYLVRVYDPFLYSHFMHCRKLILGNDLLAQTKPPSRNAFTRAILDYVPVILTFFTRRTLMTCMDAEWFAGRPIESILERALIVRLFLERKILPDSYAESRYQTEKCYPEHYQRLNRSLHAPAASLEETRFELFQLLRSTANEVHTSIQGC